jgi:hypothetical protein
MSIERSAANDNKPSAGLAAPQTGECANQQLMVLYGDESPDRTYHEILVAKSDVRSNGSPSIGVTSDVNSISDDAKLSSSHAEHVVRMLRQRI